MLPILRILPVGGVLLAIMILVLALKPPGGLSHSVPGRELAARGPLQLISDHPEWRQFLIQAATRRAHELVRLRDLPDLPVVSGDPPNIGGQIGGSDEEKVAGLPAARGDADPDDLTGSIGELPGATIPIDIGEASSVELPLTTPEETPPTIKKRERVKLPNESRKKPAQRSRRAVPAKPETVATSNIFELLFGGLQGNQTATAPPVIQPAAIPPYPQ